MRQQPTYLLLYLLTLAALPISTTGCQGHGLTSPVAEDDDPVAKLAEGLGVEYTIRESPNQNERKYKDDKGNRTGEEQKPQILVLHYTALEEQPSINVLTQDAGDGSVSAHYLVNRQGNITRLVPEDRRAWHAGYGSWGDEEDVNTASIGIENVNLGFKEKKHQPPGEKIAGGQEEWYKYDPKLLETLAPLCRNIIERHRISPNNVIGHSDMSLNRKTEHYGRKVDPGPFFPWEDFHKNHGVGAWYDLEEPLKKVKLPKEGASDAEKKQWVREHLKKYGYAACPQREEEHGDKGTEAAIRAFQLHFCPSNNNGKADDVTINILAHLVDKYCP